MKKLVLIILVVSLIGFFGYQEVMNYVADQVLEKVAQTAFSSEQVDKLLQDPEMKKLVESQVNNEQLKAKIEATLKTEGIAAISTKEDAIDLLQSKFSVSEIKDLISTVTSSDSTNQLQNIQATLQTKLTAEEIEALKVIALVEVLNNK